MQRMLTSISLEVYIFQPFIRRGLPNAVKRSRQKYHSSLPGSSPLLPVTARITCSRSQMRLCYSWRFLRVRTRTGMSLYYTILFSRYANSLFHHGCSLSQSRMYFLFYSQNKRKNGKKLKGIHNAKHCGTVDKRPRPRLFRIISAKGGSLNADDYSAIVFHFVSGVFLIKWFFRLPLSLYPL